MKVAEFAPRESASIPSAPVPAKISSTFSTSEKNVKNRFLNAVGGRSYFKAFGRFDFKFLGCSRDNSHKISCFWLFFNSKNFPANNFIDEN